MPDLREVNPHDYVGLPYQWPSGSVQVCSGGEGEHFSRHWPGVWRV